MKRFALLSVMLFVMVLMAVENCPKCEEGLFYMIDEIWSEPVNGVSTVKTYYQCDNKACKYKSSYTWTCEVNSKMYLDGTRVEYLKDGQTRVFKPDGSEEKNTVTKAGIVFYQSPACPECRSKKKYVENETVFCAECNHSFGPYTVECKKGNRAEKFIFIYVKKPECDNCHSLKKYVFDGEVFCADCEKCLGPQIIECKKNIIEEEGEGDSGCHWFKIIVVANVSGISEEFRLRINTHYASEEMAQAASSELNKKKYEKWAREKAGVSENTPVTIRYEIEEGGIDW